MESFETNTILNEAVLREIKYHLMTPGRKGVILVIILLALGLLAAGIAVGNALYIALASLAVVVFVVEFFVIIHRNVTLFLRRIRENNHTGEFQYSTSFTQEGMQIVNHTTGNTHCIFYQDIESVREAANYYLVFTRAKQFSLIDRAAIDSAGKKEALRAFLLGRNPRIRWK